MNEFIIIPGFTACTFNTVELSRKLGALIAAGGFSCAVNAEKFWFYKNNIICEEFRAASIRIVDGASIKVIAKLRYNLNLEKIDFPGICIAHAYDTMTPLGLIGGREETSANALLQLKVTYPGLQSYAQHGYGSMDAMRIFLKTNFGNEKGIVLLGLGSPKQERVANILSQEFPKLFFVCCGGAIANLAGEQQRAPLFIQKSNFEWLYRLFMDPRTRIKRLHRLLPIAFLILKILLKIDK